MPDEILVGTSNARLITVVKTHFPQARIVVTAETPVRALALYEAGADYVYLPNRLVGAHLIPMIRYLVRGEEVFDRQAAMDELRVCQEVLP